MIEQELNGLIRKYETEIENLEYALESLSCTDECQIRAGQTIKAYQVFIRDLETLKGNFFQDFDDGRLSYSDIQTGNTCPKPKPI